MRSNENMCFAWAVIASLFPTYTNANRIASYPSYSEVLNLDGITFPVSLDQITKFERLNAISVNVSTFEENRNRFNRSNRKRQERFTILPLRLTENKQDRHVNLLYVCDPEPDNIAGHFVTIRNLSRLVGRQLSTITRKAQICDRFVYKVLCISNAFCFAAITKKFMYILDVSIAS